MYVIQGDGVMIYIVVLYDGVIINHDDVIMYIIGGDTV